MQLRRYCVTVMDNWTPLRLFWTQRAALAWRDKVGNHAHAWKWINGTWWKMFRDRETAR